MTMALSEPMLTNATIARDIAPDGETQVLPPVNHTPPVPPFLAARPAPTRRRPSFGGLAEANRYPLAMAVSVGLHGAIFGAMLVDWPFHRTSDTPPPAAMVVELAIMPASPPVPPSEIPPGPEQVEAAPKPIPQERMRFDPPPQVDPALKPVFALPVRQQTTPLDAQTIAKTARETTAPQTTQAPPQDKAEAPLEGRNNAPPSDAEQAWEGRILAKLERNKRYPASAQSSGQEGTVFIRLVIDRRGRLVDASISKGSSIALLDSETMALARRASPFPAPPDSIPGERIVRIVPVEYYIKSRR